MKSPRLSIVVPCFNEELILKETAGILIHLINQLVEEGRVAADSYILFVNDGSGDNTWDLIRHLHEKDNRVKGLNLSINSGQQNALMAGLLQAGSRSNVVISIDADLQDDVNCIREMLDAYQQGVDIVYGIRRSRKKDTFFKRTTAHMFYRCMTLMGAKTIYNHADFRLMSNSAIRLLEEYPERNLFLRGIIPQLGCNAAYVYYDRNERNGGTTKYSLHKMFNFAVDGITSFSIRPLRLIASLGFLFLFCSLIAIGYTLYSWFGGETVAGWASLMISVWFLGSLILIAIGIAGEYVGKIYLEVKQRPRYHIEEYLD